MQYNLTILSRYGIFKFENKKRFHRPFLSFFMHAQNERIFFAVLNNFFLNIRCLVI